MNENTFWITFWALCVVVIVAVTGLTMNYHKSKNAMMLKTTDCEQLAFLEGYSVEHRLTLCAMGRRV